MRLCIRVVAQRRPNSTRGPFLRRALGAAPHPMDRAHSPMFNSQDNKHLTGSNALATLHAAC